MNYDGLATHPGEYLLEDRTSRFFWQALKVSFHSPVPTKLKKLTKQSKTCPARQSKVKSCLNCPKGKVKFKFSSCPAYSSELGANPAVGMQDITLQ